MKKNLILLFFFASSFLCVSAQNVQLHFDPRHSLHKDDFARNYFTVTFEMFKADKWGSTYMFVDLDMSQKKGNFGLAYTEVHRDQKIGKLPVRAHVEFNGGLTNGGSIPNAYLAGVSYPKTIGKLNFNTYVAYKYNAFDKGSHDVQWTLTWGGDLLKNKLTLSGVVDVWTENKNRTKGEGKNGKRVVFITEPQIWYNVTKNFSVGSEVEITSNFCVNKHLVSNKAYVNPTLALKWNF